jgi:hypothetical protein
MAIKGELGWLALNVDERTERMTNFLFCRIAVLVARWFRGTSFTLLDMGLGEGFTQTSLAQEDSVDQWFGDARP